MKLGYIAIGHNGTTLHLTQPDKHPRKQLLDKLGTSKAQKIFRDKIKGGARHVGYIARGEWFAIYEIHEWGDQPDNAKMAQKVIREYKQDALIHGKHTA